MPSKTPTVISSLSRRPLFLDKVRGGDRNQRQHRRLRKSKNQPEGIGCDPQPLGYPPRHLDVLNNMILPRDWKAPNGKHFMQYVSHQKSERSDVVRLKEALDQALEYRQART
uniref:Uncharacterized protein n=1 Tax=Nymphaea colorata TaxID=210225 RepID=A0A5K1H9N8_9MAGN|nr:unnamed protein product [Nymphaea colorata]